MFADDVSHSYHEFLRNRLHKTAGVNHYFTLKIIGRTQTRSKKKNPNKSYIITFHVYFFNLQGFEILNDLLYV